MPIDVSAMDNVWANIGTALGNSIAKNPTPATPNGVTAPATAGGVVDPISSTGAGTLPPNGSNGVVAPNIAPDPTSPSSISAPSNGVTAPISAAGDGKGSLPTNGSGGVVAPTGSTGSAGATTPDAPPVDPNAPKPFDMSDAFKKLFDQLTTTNNTSQAALLKQIQDQADAQAKAQSDKQEALYQNQIQQLTNTHNEGLQSVQNNTLGAQTNLDNNYFQKWLQSRQEAANRGMASSGIGQDQDTRLLLSKQQDLAGILRDAASQNYHLDNTYATGKTGVQGQEALNNPSAISAQLFKDLYKTATDSADKHSTAAASLLEKAFGYYMPTQDALLKEGVSAGNNANDNATKLQIEKWKNSSAEQIAILDDNTKLQIAQLPWTAGLTSDEKAKHILELTKIMGRDDNGNPTLDATKAQQQANHWAASDATAKASIAAQLSMSKDKLAASLADSEQKATQAALQLKETQYAAQGNMLSNAITAKNAEIGQLNNQIAGVGGKGKDPALDAQFADALNLTNSLQQSLVALSDTTSSGATSKAINTPGLNK